MYLGKFCGVALMLTVSFASAQEQPTSSDCAGLAANSAESAIRSCRGEVVDPAEAALLGQDPVSGSSFPSDQPFDSITGEAEYSMDPARAPTALEVLGEPSPPAPSAPRMGPLVQIDAEDWASEQERVRSRVSDTAEPATRDVFWQATPRLTPLTPTAKPHVEIDGQVVPMDEWLEGTLPGRLADPVGVATPDEGEGPASTLPPATETRHSAVIDGVTVDLDLVSYELLGLILRSSGVAEIEELPTAQPEVLEELPE